MEESPVGAEGDLRLNRIVSVDPSEEIGVLGSQLYERSPQDNRVRAATRERLEPLRELSERDPLRRRNEPKRADSADQLERARRDLDGRRRRLDCRRNGCFADNSRPPVGEDFPSAVEEEPITGAQCHDLAPAAREPCFRLFYDPDEASDMG